MTPVSINGIEFDALISQDKTYEAEIPDYPVETGFAVSDTITIKPVQLNLVLYLTPTPVTWADRHSGGREWVESVCDDLEEMFFSKELVEIVTMNETYTDMGITSLTISDTQEDGYAKKITCTAKKVFTTSTDTADIPAEIAQSGATGTAAGVASTSTTDPTASSSSSSSSTTSEDSKKGQSILYGVASGLNFL